MPDVAAIAAPEFAATLDWVGMSGIAAPLRIVDATVGAQTVPARVQTYVNLQDPDVKGIHMSRLYLALGEAESDDFTPKRIEDLLKHMVESHEGLSDQAALEFQFDVLLDQPALKSDNSGHKAYPVTLLATWGNGGMNLEMRLVVAYSSTCPCSAALSRQLLTQEFVDSFDENSTLSVQEVAEWIRANGSYATPHSQRSLAHVKVKLDAVDSFPIAEVVAEIENALQTPVQTAVKREDEQEFARLNGQNQMFCEDAARKLKASLQHHPDFWIRVEHLESLHAHDAVAIASKGVSGGYAPSLS